MASARTMEAGLLTSDRTVRWPQEPVSNNGRRPLTPGPLSVRITVAAALLGIGRTKLYELIGAGEIELIKVGKVSLIPMRALEDFVDRHAQSAAAGRPPVSAKRGRPKASFVGLAR